MRISLIFLIIVAGLNQILAVSLPPKSEEVLYWCDFEANIGYKYRYPFRGFNLLKLRQRLDSLRGKVRHNAPVVESKYSKNDSDEGDVGDEVNNFTTPINDSDEEDYDNDQTTTPNIDSLEDDDHDENIYSTTTENQSDEDKEDDSNSNNSKSVEIYNMDGDAYQETNLDTHKYEIAAELKPEFTTTSAPTYTNGFAAPINLIQKYVAIPDGLDTQQKTLQDGKQRFRERFTVIRRSNEY